MKARKSWTAVFVAALMFTIAGCGSDSTTGPNPPPPPPPPQMGTLDVSSAPPGAVITINGANAGEVTPATFTKAPGSYQVSITLDGYEDYIVTVQVVANQTAQVSADLTLISPSEFYVGTVRNLLKGTITNGQVTTEIHRAVKTGGLAIEGNIAIAYTTNGLEISRDNLTTWQVIGGCPNELDPEGLAGKAIPVPLTSTNPVEGWLATGPVGDFIYSYSESGCTSLRDRLPYQRGNGQFPLGVLDITVNPKNRSEAWLFGEAAIWHTTDSGQNIEVQLRDLDAALWAGAFSESRLYVAGDKCCVNGKTQGTVWRSDNGGQNWQSFSTGLPVGSLLSIKIDPFNPDRLWVGNSGRGTWESTDGGQTWQQVSQGIWVADLELIGDFLYDPSRRAEVGVWNWQLYNTFETGIVLAVPQ